MNNTIVVLNKEILGERKRSWNGNRFMSRVGKSASLILISAMFVVGSIVALSFGVPIKSVMKNYSYDVIAILIVMELFTNLIAETGIMQLLAIKIAELSKGRKRLCLIIDRKSVV